MSTTRDHPEDPQSHGRPPAEPHTPDRIPAERPRTHDALAWSTLGLTAVFGTAGAVLTLTGHAEAGSELIKAAVAAASVRARK
ncbi:hypothetical protein [Streptomyces sp. NPDC048644]|uniref:hypothetical protein n=1 Tax=Streptomyces sp. NPDC048644 TaxID=3365582 RepID=UPI003711FC80